MKRLRILYHHRIRAEDGQAVHVRELVSALQEAGHDVRECALVRKTGASGADGKRGFWQGLRLPRLVSEVLEALYSPQGTRMLLQAAKDFRPDFLYERHALHCRAGLDAARALGVPLLLEVNAPLGDEMEALGRLRLRRRARACEREVLQGADAVLAVTGVLRRRLVELGADPSRTQVIGNGADPRRYDAVAEDAVAARRRELGPGPLLGFVGHVREWHRLDLLVEALAAPDLRAVRLVVAGEGPGLGAAFARARTLGVESRVLLLGTVSPARLPLLVKACDATVIPAINPYASPLKLFDSLAAGVVTITPDQENLREVVQQRETGLLFEPGSCASLVEALRFLLADPERARRLGQAGRELLVRNDWTWAGNARRVVDAFERCRR